jgi:hypothetical protein
MTFRAVVGDLARLAQGTLVGHETSALPIAGTGTLFADRARCCERYGAFGVRSAHAHRLAVDRGLTVAESAALATLATTACRRTEWIARCYRADADAAGDVTGGAQIRARRVATHTVHAIGGVAVGALQARCAQRPSDSAHQRTAAFHKRQIAAHTFAGEPRTAAVARRKRFYGLDGFLAAGREHYIPVVDMTG